MAVLRCARCGAEQDTRYASCASCGAALRRRTPAFRQLLATGDIVSGESGDRAMKLLLISLLILAGLTIIGFIVVWWATYRQANNEPFTMSRPPVVQPYVTAPRPVRLYR